MEERIKAKAEEIIGKDLMAVLEQNEITVSSIDLDTSDALVVHLNFCSDAGEDFWFTVDAQSREDFLLSFREYAEYFDIDEHVEMLRDAGAYGTPDFETLVDDSKKIKKFLEDVSNELSDADEGIVKDETTPHITGAELVKKLENLEKLENLVDLVGEFNCVEHIINDKNIHSETIKQLTKIIETNMKRYRDNSDNISSSFEDIEIEVDPLSIDMEHKKPITELEVIDWGRKQIYDLTFGKMCREVTPSSYDDFIGSHFVLKAFNNYQDDVANGTAGGISFKDYFTECAEDDFYDNISDMEDDLMKDISSRAKKESPEFQEAFEKFTKNYNFFSMDYDFTYECLEALGYEGTYVDINAYLGTNYHLNIMLATPQERNCDMSSITIAFPALSDVPNKFGKKDFDKVSDNALTYLIHQQGHTVESVMNCLYKDEYPKSEIADNEKFINSIASEINENYYGGMSELTMLVCASGEDLLNVLDSIAHKEGYISVPQNTTIGLYNEWSGAGATFEISLDKPFVFPASMVRNVQFESYGDDRVPSKTNDGYTVNEVYGFVGSAWEKGTVSITDNAPALTEENMKKTFETFKGYVQAEKEQNAPKKAQSNVERD